MAKIIGKLLERVLCVILAALFCQFPSYLNQYTTRLSGHIGELSLIYRQIEELANSNNKSVEQYVKKFSKSTDDDFKSQSVLLQNIIDRKSMLQQTYANLISASIWKKPFIFATTLDSSIAMQTINLFKPGLVLSLESAVYAFLGILTATALFKLVCTILSGLFRSRNQSSLT